MIRPVSDAAEHATPEDWRILRALSFYRLLLVTLQLVLYETGYLARIFDVFLPRWFYATCVVYAIVSLLLFLPIVYRRPPATLQSHGHFAVDVLALTSLAYACGGVPSGLGMLLLTPAVGCSLIVTPRMSLVQAAFATFVVFAEEVIRQYTIGYDTTPFTQTGILGLMFFATSVAASAVASRARRSEALAEQVGTDLASLSRLNQRIIEQMQTGVVAVEADGSIRLLNQAAARWIGGSIGQPLARAAPGLAVAMDHWKASRLAEGEPVRPRDGGEELIPRFSRLASGNLAPVLILLDSAQELRERARQMKLAALGRLSAGIAHEIRNPLSAISHAGQLLSESPGLGEENLRLLAMIRRHSDRIDRIIKDVLGLSRSSGATPGDIALQSWLRTAITQYRESHPGEERNIALDQVPGGLTVRFDPSHLQQVLYNLWDNSFTHGRRPGQPFSVSLSAHWLEAGQRPYLEISDNGAGIPAELADRVFEPFFTTGAHGTGLGLYLARELCEYNRARLLYLRPVPDPPATGARFRLLFAEAAPA